MLETLTPSRRVGYEMTTATMPTSRATRHLSRTLGPNRAQKIIDGLNPDIEQRVSALQVQGWVRRYRNFLWHFELFGVEGVIARNSDSEGHIDYAQIRRDLRLMSYTRILTKSEVSQIFNEVQKNIEKNFAR